MQTYADIIVRTILAIFSVLLIARLLGKQTISNMTLHDFVTNITLGSVAANLAFNVPLKYSYFILTLGVMASISFLLSIIAIKSSTLRKWISGSPTVLIENGKILENNMKKIRYTLDTLNQVLRSKGIFNLNEVDYAVLEDNGTVSVLLKEDYQFVTRKDMKLAPSTQKFPIELVMDGVILEQNLQNQGLSKEWLENEVRSRGKRIADVLYAVRGTHQQLFFDYYQDDIRKPIDKE
ncbi:DUF421 domain-containing protein [Paenibacillus sp. FSL K6-1230]|uniref:DUF421 domain-containing protein n=1 Tax=Paenibacillus sp. FSL K6-1230 TaxID=2921603 RepID=UPI0003A93E8C